MTFHSTKEPRTMLTTSDASRHPKYQPIIWATVDDALDAQKAEAAGLAPTLVSNNEGYLTVRGVQRRPGLLRAA